MSEFKPRTADEIIKEKEPDIQELCSPYSGNCFEVALALYRIFSKQSEGFWSVYANTEFVEDSDVLPLHVVVQIQGELFDAGGKLYQSHLLEEFAPEQNPDLLSFEDTFQYENAVADNLLIRVMGEYKFAFDKKSE